MSEKIKVDLIAYTPNPLDVIYTAMRCCYNAGTPNEMYKNRSNYSYEDKIKLVNRVIGSHHWSTIEHVSLTFAIAGIDRNCSHQLVRKRIASYSQQSLRYTNIAKDCDLADLTGFRFGQRPTEEKIEFASRYYTDVNEKNCEHYISTLYDYCVAVENGMKKEEARNLLSSNVRTNLVMTVNLRSFLDLLGHRCCTRAQKPIRILANKMKEAVKATGEFEFIDKFLGPKCEQNGFCDEGEMCCGRKKTLEELISD